MCMIGDMIGHMIGNFLKEKPYTFSDKLNRHQILLAFDLKLFIPLLHSKVVFKWLPRMDLNHENLLQREMCYRYTTGY